MRVMRFGLLIVLLVWLTFMFRLCATDTKLTVCSVLCDQRGRELASMNGDWIVRCNCGETKKAPKSLERP